MRHGSLFSGIGGFDLAAEWMGWENVFHCEWNPFGQKVLKHYWPKAESFEDITKSDFTKYANTIDILTGGFPCQPYSSAGKRLGKEDERHLWPEMLRAIREIAPRFVVGENVRGLTNWNGGLVFDEVCAELENLGYQVAPVIIPACAVNAPHRRERVWFVAYANDTRTNITMRDKRKWQKNNKQWERQSFDKYWENGGYGITTNPKFKSTGSDRGTNNETQGDLRRGNTGDVFGTLCSNGNATDTDGIGLRGKGNGIGKSGFNGQKVAPNGWIDFPTESPICGGDDGIPDRLDNITIPKWRKESLKAYGNAIVPQVALEIFKAIERVDDTLLMSFGSWPMSICASSMIDCNCAFASINPASKFKPIMRFLILLKT